MALELHDWGAAAPIVVCGRNEALARQLREDGIEHANGWVDDMPGPMHAADVLVQNAGGLTSPEAFATGQPIAGYRCIPGHGPGGWGRDRRGGRCRLDPGRGRTHLRLV